MGILCRRCIKFNFIARNLLYKMPMETLVKMAISKHDLDNGLVFNRRQATV